MELANEVLLDLRGRRLGALWRVRAVVGLSAGVFVATLLAGFSVRVTAELAPWWGLAMLFAVIAWGTVVIAWQGAVYLLPKTMRLDGWLPSCVRFLVISVISLLMVAVTGIIVKLPLAGLVIAFVPFVIPVALFWVIGRDMGVKSCLCAGVLLLAICARLFTLPSAAFPGEYPLAGTRDDDVRMMSWNLGGGGPFFPGSNDDDIDAIAEIASKHGVHILCLQEVSSMPFLQKLLVALGDNWKGGASSGGGKSTAVLSRIGGEVKSPFNGMDYGGPTVLRIRSHKGTLQFVSCHGSPGRESGQRRKMVEWVLQ